MLAVLSVGLAAQGLVILFSRALYAVRQSWRPLFYQLAGCTVTIFLAVIFLFIGKDGVPSSLAVFMRVGDVHGTGILLLAVSATLGQIFLAILSLFALRNIAPGLAGMLRRPFMDGCIAAVAGGVATYAVLLIEGGIAPLTTFIVENEEFRIVTNSLARLLKVPNERSTVLSPSAEEPPKP